MLERDDDLTPRLREAVRLLRDAPAPSDVWRHRLARSLAEAAHPVRMPAHAAARERRWSMRPLTAIAAGLVCVALGGLAGAVVSRTGDPQAPTAGLAGEAAPGVSTVRFSLVAPAAGRVSLVGDFNGWNPDALPLRRSSDGMTWEVEVPLAPGRYAYSFVVDGELARDPAAPQVKDDDFGSPNSVLMVRGS